MKVLLASLLLCLALGLAACGDEGDSTTQSVATLNEPREDIPQRPEPKIELPDREPPERLIVTDLIKGKGPGAQDGDKVTLTYKGVYYTSGKLWSSTWKNTPFPLKYELGSGEMMEGWEKGLRGMKLGGRRQLVIPPDYIYSSPYGVGPEDTLLYVLDLVALDS
jgi:peptidylprolyl isomerase